MKNISKLFLAIASLAVAATASAQHPLEKPFSTSGTRQEIVFPKVKGMNVYKGDFHTHTIYSDGEVTPDARVIEAWRDGLDIIAITDHMEYRRVEREMYYYMKDNIREDLKAVGKAVNTNVLKQGPDNHGLLVDFNVSCNSAIKKGKDMGLLVVRGVEITRSDRGDYNALFTTDNNKLYDPDLEQTIRNARAQGAFIIHNHPSYDKNTENHITPFTNDLYAKGLIDGVEIANYNRMWTYLFTHCIAGGFTPFGNTGAHDYVEWIYRMPSDATSVRYRNMTLVFAKECTEKAIHKALREGNTIAYHNNNLIGREQLLKDLFEASVTFEFQRTGSSAQYVTVKNNSSMPYYIQVGNNKYIINALGSLAFKRPKNETAAKVTVLNMWYGNEDHPSFEISWK